MFPEKPFPTPKSLYIWNGYYRIVEKFEMQKAIEMETNREHKNENIATKQWELYIPFDPDRYILPTQKAPRWKLPSKNNLVDHVLCSIKKESLQNSSQGTIDDIFEDRLTLIRSKIEMILLQLDERKKIHRNMVYGITKDSCKAQNLIYERLTKSYDMDGERINLEQMKFDLRQQERKEAASYFNDTCQLNSELREALTQYQEEVQKNMLISEMEVSP